jgi:Flp pilus assembly protein TadG
MFQNPGSKSLFRKAVCDITSGSDGESGTAIVEFTIFAPLLLIVAIYTMDFGLIFFRKMEVQHAAQAGAQYAIATNSYDSAAISSAVTQATNFTSVTPSSSQFCGCPAATNVNYCSASCDTCNVGTCPLSVQGHYVTVTATTSYSPLIQFGLFSSSSYNLSATSTVRIR